MNDTVEVEKAIDKKKAFAATTPLSWKTLPNSPVASSRTDDIWFFNENEGWLVNSSGYVCKTTNGGECWEPKFYLCPASKGKPYLRCMGWGSKKVGWFGSVTGIGDDGLKNPENYLNTLLHHTTDGGETWAPVTNLPKGSPAGICGFYAVNEQVAYGSGTNDPGLPGPAIVKTTDGGASWELIDMKAHADNLIDIYFMDEDNGFVVGGKIHDQCDINYAGYPPPRLIKYAQLKPVILRTTDGGKSWTNVAANTSGFLCGEWGWKIQFINEKSGFVSLENFVTAGILKTTDGGQTWVRHAVQDVCGNIINKDLEGIGFINEKQGWVGGWGNNFAGLMNSYTNDGGLTWQSQDHNDAIPHSDDRLRINRYRFIGNPVTAGYCSGQQVYKLQIGCTKKAALAKKTALASASVRREPARSDEGSMHTASAMVQQHNFDLSYTQQEDGKVEISYQLPENAGKVFVGLWNQFAFYVKTLVHGAVTRDGRQTIVWDGSDDEGNDLSEGVYICRLSVDGCQGGSQMVKLERN